MAPELIRGEPVTPAADIYAVGVILYELVTGTTPFGGGTSDEIFERHLSDDVVPASLRCPDRIIPPALDALIVRALAKDPNTRIAHALVLADELDRILPALCSAEQVVTTRGAFSTSGPTRQWTVAPRSRLPEDAMPPPRTQDGAALASECLARARELVAEHRLVEATQELEQGAQRVVVEAGDPGASWRLLLTLAALYDGLGDIPHAWSTVLEARRIADESGDPVGHDRASALLRRFDAAAHTRRAG